MVAVKMPRMNYDRRVYMGIYRSLPAQVMGFTLGTLNPKDANRYYQATNNWEMASKLGGTPLLSLGKAREIVKSTYLSYESGAATRLAIRDSEGQLAGVISITRPKASDYLGHDVFDENIWEIGYWLMKEYRGKGVGTATVRKALEMMASAMEGQSTTVVARCWDDNEESLRLLRKCGFMACFRQKNSQGTIVVYSLKLV